MNDLVDTKSLEKVFSHQQRKLNIDHLDSCTGFGGILDTSLSYICLFVCLLA